MNLRPILSRALWTLVAAALCAAPTTVTAQSLRGDWTGRLAGPDGVRHVAVHIRPGAGGPVGTLDIAELGAHATPLTRIADGDGRLAFATDRASYQGRWDAAIGAWRGVWTEAGSSAPLTLAWTNDSLVVVP